MPVFTELAALRRKDGATLAATLHQSCATIIDLLLAGFQASGCKLRVIIMVTGDTIGTNENASKRLWEAMQKYKPNSVHVSLVSAKCASHVSNLAVQAAICGSSRKEKRLESEICANCSRFYKHMARDYVEEWGYNLQAYLLQHANEMFHAESADRMSLASRVSVVRTADLILGLSNLRGRCPSLVLYSSLKPGLHFSDYMATQCCLQLCWTCTVRGTSLGHSWKNSVRRHWRHCTGASFKWKNTRCKQDSFSLAPAFGDFCACSSSDCQQQCSPR